MINLRYEHKLLFCSLDLTIANKSLHFENVLIDTGSATTLINSDYIHFDGNEELINVHGVGGYESVLMKHFKYIYINNVSTLYMMFYYVLVKWIMELILIYLLD